MKETEKAEESSPTRLEDAVLERIEQMEDPAYRFPPRFTRRDYLLTAAVALACLALVIAGAWL